MKTINNVKITPPCRCPPPPEFGLGDSNFVREFQILICLNPLLQIMKKDKGEKIYPPPPCRGRGTPPKLFQKILLRGKKPLPENFKAIGTLIQMLLISGTFLAKMFHSAMVCI